MIWNVNNFIGAVSYLMETGFVEGLSLRGAITKGDFLVDNERHVFLSNVLLQAVKFEGEPEWTGCVIFNEAEEIVVSSIFREGIINRLKTRMQLRNNPVHYYSVPFKSKSKDYFVIKILFF